MPPIFQTSNTSTGTGTAATVTKPSGTVQFDLLVGVVDVESGTDVGITPPTGWTLVRRQDQLTDVGLAVFFKQAGASEPADYTWTLTASKKFCAGIARIEGAPGVLPVDVQDGDNSSTASASVPAPSVTTTLDDELVLCFYTNKKSSTYTPDGSTIERWDDPNVTDGLPSNMMATFDQLTAGATGAKTATASDSDTWATITVALRQGVKNLEVALTVDADFTMALNVTIPLAIAKSASAVSENATMRSTLRTCVKSASATNENEIPRSRVGVT